MFNYLAINSLAKSKTQIKWWMAKIKNSQKPFPSKCILYTYVMCWKFSFVTVFMHGLNFGWSIKSTMCFPLHAWCLDVELELYPKIVRIIFMHITII